jgi:hypothetical protein
MLDLQGSRNPEGKFTLSTPEHLAKNCFRDPGELLTQALGDRPLKRNNPFSENIAGEYFVGREGEFKQFQANLGGLADGSANHAFVAGLHGTGKTSYLDRLVTIARDDGFVGVLTNVTEKLSGVRNVKAVLWAIADAIQKWGDGNNQSLSTRADWEKGKDSTLFRQCKTDTLEADLARADLSTLWRIASDAGARGIVVCIDEGQWLKPEALSTLKSAFEVQSHFVAVISLRLTVVNENVRKAGRALLEGIANEAGGDIGASRLFTTEIAMGPFVDDAEGKRCIERRLRDNAIAFDEDLSHEIVQLAACVPREIILYSQKVYAKADEASLSTADVSLLDEVVRELHASEIAQAAGMVEQLSMSARTLIKGLLELNGCATDAQLAQRIQAEADAETLATITHGVRGQLDAVCKKFPGLTRQDDVFEVANRAHFYALRIALEER